MSQALADPVSAVQTSQRASKVLAGSSSIFSVFPLSLINATETPAIWAEYEQTFHACLHTGDDESAYLCLDKMSKRFGPTDERVMALKGMYQEAIAEDETSLKNVLADYNKTLSQNPMIASLHKRRVALLKSLGEPQLAIGALTDFLDSFPSDTESWCELAELYFSQGLSAQAIFSLEEGLLSAPFAWNLHARLGEMEYLTAVSNTEGVEASQKGLASAVRRFSRSVELCDDYVRGYYGLKIATEALTKMLSTKSSGSDLPSGEVLKALNSLATRKLEKIVKDRSTPTAPGPHMADIVAAKALLDRKKA